MISALYTGVVTHSRTRPRRHALRYRIFQVLIDLAELPVLDERLRLFSRNRFNLVSFHDRDHGAGDGALRAHVERLLAKGGVAFDGGPIRLLCMPRILGYVFNPISVYFCHRGCDGALAAVLYEVNNTFGQRHSYLFPVTANEPVLQHGCGKAFYVSPFMAMDMRYDFRLTLPAERFALAITGSDGAGPLIAAAFAGDRTTLTDRTLWRAFCGAPLLTLKVVAGIHWEALKLLAKGVRLTRRPPAPAEALTVG